MKLNFQDLVATVLVAVVGVAYVGYLAYGSVPYVEDPRGMAAVGVILGAAAFLVMRWGDTLGRFEKVTTAVAVAALLLGLVTVALGETAAAEALLAAFMVSVVVVWAMEIADHAGLVHRDHGAAAHV